MPGELDDVAVDRDLRGRVDAVHAHAREAHAAEREAAGRALDLDLAARDVLAGEAAGDHARARPLPYERRLRELDGRAPDDPRPRAFEERHLADAMRLERAPRDDERRRALDDGTQCRCDIARRRDCRVPGSHVIEAARRCKTPEK